MSEGSTNFLQGYCLCRCKAARCAAMGATGCDFLCLDFLTVQLPLRDPFLKQLSVAQHSAGQPCQKPRTAGAPRAEKPYMSTRLLISKASAQGSQDLIKRFGSNFHCVSKGTVEHVTKPLICNPLILICLCWLKAVIPPIEKYFSVD